MSTGKANDVKVPSYYASVQFTLCHGPVDAIKKILVDNRELKSFIPTEGTNIATGIDNFLFGGTGREGGISGIIKILFGRSSQGRDSYLQGFIGSDCPAYRGVVSVILQNVYLGLNYYFKQWSFVVQRIHIQTDESSQWQDGLSEISEVAFSATLVYNVTDTDVMFVINPISGFNTLYVGDVLTIGAEKVSVDGIDRNTNKIWVTRGILGTSVADTGLGALSNYHYSGNSLTGYVPKLINAIHVVRECLVNTKWGLAIPGTSLHDVSFISAAQTCYDEKLGFSWFWDKETKLEDFIEEVLDHVKGVLYVDPVDNLFHLDLVRKLNSLSGLTTLNTSNIKEVTSVHKKLLPELVSRVSLQFTDVSSGQNKSVTMSNDSLIARQGTVKDLSLQYSGVVTPLVAQKLVSRELQQNGVPVYSCTIKCNRDAENFRKGTAFILDWPEIFENPLVMRVLTVNLGNNLQESITIEAVEDVFDDVVIEYAPPLPSSWVNPVSSPAPVTYRKVVELPYYMAARLKGDSAASSIPTTSSYLLIYAKAPSLDAMGANINVSSGANYEKRGNVSYCFSSTLAANLSITATTVSLDDVTDFDALVSPGELLQIEDEIVSVVSRSGNVITIERGCLDTVPAAHSSGTMAYGWLDFYGIDEIEYAVGELVTVKLTNYTPAGELSLVQATSDNLNFTGRLHKPYPPGNVRLNSVAYPSSITGVLTVSWSHRDRLQQTAGLVPTTNGNIGPETGTSYTLRLYNSSNTLVRTIKTTGTSYVWATEIADSGGATMNGTFRIELESTRDGFTSQFKHDISCTRTGSLTTADSPLTAPTGLTSSNTSTNIVWSWSSAFSGTYSFEILISPVNDRDSSEAVVISTGTALTYSLSASAGTYYAWIRPIYNGKIGEWVPSGSTAGVSGVAFDDVGNLLNLVTP